MHFKEVIACGLPSLWQRSILQRKHDVPTAALDGQTLLFSHSFTIILIICFSSCIRMQTFLHHSDQTSVVCSNVMRHLSATSSPSPDISVHPPLPLCWSTHPNPQLQAQQSWSLSTLKCPLGSNGGIQIHVTLACVLTTYFCNFVV